MIPGLPKVLEQWAKIRLAHQATMVDDAQKVLAQARELTRAHQERTTGPALGAEEESMIHIGDQVTMTPAPAPARSLAPLLWAGLLAAASALGGAGLVAALLPRIGPALAPSSPVGPQDFKVDFFIDAGKVKTEVTPLPPPRPAP